MNNNMRLYTHTEDGRRFATSLVSIPFRVQLEVDNMDIERHPTWKNALDDGVAMNLRTLTNDASEEVYEEYMKNHQRRISERVLREIDLRGPKYVKQKLKSNWRSPMNMRREMGVGCGMYKSAVTARPISCGGGGGR